MTGHFMRALASCLMLHATFPLDVLADTAPLSTAAPATQAATGAPNQADHSDCAAFIGANCAVTSTGDLHAR